MAVADVDDGDRIEVVSYETSFHRRKAEQSLMVVRQSKSLKAVTVTLLGSILLESSPGCATKAGTGALVGGAAGAGVGAIIGHNSHNRTGSGALIGGAVGAIGGALIGNEMDKSDHNRERVEDRAYDDRYDRGPSRSYASTRVTKDDVVAWSSRGMRNSEIIDRIDRSGTVFHLTAADENQLRDAGVSEEVIREMKDTARH